MYLIFPSPRGRTHSGVVWSLSGLLAHCQACGAAFMGSGILAGVDWQGAQGWEGQAQLTFPSEIRFRRGPVALGGRQTCWRDDLQMHSLGVCAVQASSVTGTGSLWDFG